MWGAIATFLGCGCASYHSAHLPLHTSLQLSACRYHCAGVLGAIATFLGSRSVNIEQEVTASRGFLAYIMLDMGPVPDPAQLQVRVDRARWCGSLSAPKVCRLHHARHGPHA